MTRAEACAEAFQPGTYERGGVTVVLESLRGDEKKVVVSGSVSRGGVEIGVSWPVIVTNPPLCVVRDGKPVEDPLNALIDVVAGLVT